MYYVIHDFMVKDLNLCGIDLNVFAIIYSFDKYNGSLETLMKMSGVKSITTIQTSLKRLISLGLIEKDKPHNKFSTCTYRVKNKVIDDFKVRKSVSSRREWKSNSDFPVIGGKL